MSDITSLFTYKKQHLLEYGYYVLIFICSLIGESISQTLMVTVASINIFYGDVINASVLLAILIMFIRGRLLKLHKESYLYFGLLLVLLLALLLGFMKYSYRAIGEARLILPFLWIYLVSIFYKGERFIDSKYLIKMIRNTIFISAVAGLIAFPFGFIFNFKLDWEDFRGIRYIYTNQSFSIMIMICLLLLKAGVRRLNLKEILFLCTCIIILILSKNRAAVAAPAFVFLLLTIIQGKIKTILYAAVAIILLVGTIFVVSSSATQEIFLAFKGVFDPLNDSTGSWRFALQSAALAQALETFWLGQWFGSYFAFNVPGMNWSLLNEIQPHNQFLILFLKTGIVGVTLYVLLLLKIIWTQIYVITKHSISKDEKVYCFVLLIIISSQFLYGMAYDFYPYIGLYYGFALLLLKSIRYKAGIAKDLSISEFKFFSKRLRPIAAHSGVSFKPLVDL